MAAILELLQNRQSQYDGQLAQNHALVSKDMGSAFYTDSLAVANEVNVEKMCSWWRIATMSMDREGDVLVPAGCLGTIKTYIENPVVCFDHKRDYKLPIGKSVGHGALPVDVRENEIVAGCIHDDTTEFSRDVWQLVRKGLLRAASVSFVPLAGERVRQKAHDEEGRSFTPRFKFHQWNLTEWSICTVGINPEAIRIELSSGGLKSPEILKSLASVAQKPSIWANGFNPGDDMIALDKINRDSIGYVRFHKSRYDDAACHKWLEDNGFDKSLMVDNPKSLDFVQVAGEVGEKSDKIEQGVYVVYLKAFPPKKKDDEEDDDKKKEKPPFQGTKKPTSGKPDDKMAASKPGDKEVEDRDDHEKTSAKDDVEYVAKDDDATDESKGDDEMSKDDDQDSDQDAMDKPVDAAQPGQLTNAGHAIVDVLRHKKSELEFYKQSLQAHDHDGLKKMMMDEMKSAQTSYDSWLRNAQAHFPGVDFEAEASKPSEYGDEQQVDDEDQDQLPPGKSGDINADTLDPLKKAFDDLSEDDWDEVAISLKLAELMD